jgi:hypothetical protein
MHFENRRESRGALRRAKLYPFAFFFISFFCVAKDARAAPVITSIAPTTAVAGQQVTITGTDFGTTSWAVMFGNLEGWWIASWSDTQIVVTVPLTAQSGPVSVITASLVQSNSVYLTVVYPTITSVSPTTVLPGQELTITGTNFGTTAWAVMFGTLEGFWITSWSNTQIVVTVPATAQSGPVSVITASQVQSNSVNLTVEDQAGASLSPSSLSFASVGVDTTSADQAITLKNTGNSALSITRIAFNGADATDFTEVDTCGASVAAGGNCTIAILFTPSAAGTRTASLSIADNASGSPQTASLSGTGTHDVILTWAASETSGVEGYNVYRGATSGEENSTPLNSTPIKGITYTDEDVTAGASYYYVVKAVGSDDGNLSLASQEASATVPSS